MAYFWTHRKIGGNTKRVISKAKFNLKCKEECAICFDMHTQGESVFTECGHIYGKECWRKWMSNEYSNHSCPNCRKFCPKTSTYTLRKVRTSKI